MQEFVIPNKHIVALSDAAQRHFATIAPGKYVKLSVQGGGCAGFQYHWEILDNRDSLYDNDEFVDYEHFTLVVDGASLMFLTGSTVDYLTDITGSHIEIHNPLAKAGCGCGVSISFK